MSCDVNCQLKVRHLVGESLKIYTEHPDYTAMKEHFDLVHDAYYGTGDFLTGDALVQYKREHSTWYDDRKDQAYYVNHIKSLLQIPINTIFGAKFKRTLPGKLDQTIHSAFGDWESTWKRAAELSQLYGGVSFVGFDRSHAEMKTLADQMSNPIYLTVYDARQVVDWSFDEDGNFEWIKILENTDGRGDWTDPQLTSVRLRIWTKNEYFIYEGKSTSETELKLVASGDHAFGSVPIVPFYSQVPYAGIYTNLDSIHMSKIAVRLFNIDSEKDHQAKSSAFNFLVMGTPGGEKVKLVVGPDMAIFYDPNAGSEPTFVSPSPEPIRLHMALQDQLKSYLYEITQMTDETKESIKTATQVSHITEAAAKKIRNFALNGQKAELAIINKILQFEGLTGDVSVEWPQDYLAKSLEAQMIDNTIKLKTIDWLSPTFKATLEKDHMRKYVDGDKNYWVKVDSETDNAVQENETIEVAHT